MNFIVLDGLVGLSNSFGCRYILSIGDAGEIQEYMLELLDGSDPRVMTFISQLIKKWRPAEKPPDNMTVSASYIKNW